MCNTETTDRHNIQIKKLKPGQGKKMETILCELDAASYNDGDYRDFGEHLLGLTMTDIRRLECQCTNSSIAGHMLQSWLKKYPQATLSDLRHILRKIKRYDLDHDLMTLGIEANRQLIHDESGK